MRPIHERAHEHILNLAPYQPGEQPTEAGWVKLNTNELPYAPPVAVQEAIASECRRLARYPHPQSLPLREALAREHGLSPEEVIIGNGSDDVLALLVRAFGGRQKATVQTEPSYSLYPVITALAGGQIVSVPFEASFSLPVEAILKIQPDLCLLTCPNAPTGVRFPLEELASLAAGVPGLLVIDEAYAEFAEGTALPLLKRFSNLVITRTFSKAYGLAGLRVGYALADRGIIGVLDRVRDSYNVNRLSQAGALAALACRDHYRAVVTEIKQRRAEVHKELSGLGWILYPSESNFLFGAPVKAGGAASPVQAAGLFAHLKDEKILVRYFPGNPLTASHLRITIGTADEMQTFLDSVKRWTHQEQP